MDKKLVKVCSLFAISVLFLIINGCDKGKDSAAKKEQPAMATPPAAKMASPDVVSFDSLALYPEGVEYDAKGQRFLVTSMRYGTVGEVRDDGSYREIIKNENFKSAVGIRIDSDRDRLLVCNSDPGVSIHTSKETQGKMAGLGVFQLSTGNLIKYIDLSALSSDGGGHFCNDIGLDGEGNAYISDSFSNIIYRVDANNNASIFLANDRFKGEGFNLNGVVIKDDYLLIDKYNEGVLFKVPLNEPEKFTQVSISETYPGSDGLLWAADGSLIMIANANTNKMLKLTSVDNWASATVVNSIDTGPTFTTTGVLRDGEIYALDAQLGVLFNPDTKEHAKTFNIRRHML